MRARCDVVAAFDRGLVADGALPFDKNDAFHVGPIVERCAELLVDIHSPAPTDLGAPVPLLGGHVVVRRSWKFRVEKRLLKDAGDCGSERWLIVLQTQHVVGSTIYDLLCDLLLTPHGVDRDKAAL